MQVPQITNYILEELERGTPEIEIKQKLFRSKWLPEEIEENYEYALAQAQQMLKQYQAKRPRKGRKFTFISLFFFLIAAFLLVGAIAYFLTNTQSTPLPTSQNLFSNEATPLSRSSPVEPTPENSPQRAVFNENDRRREQHRIQIQQLLRTYFEGNRIYPETLSGLSTLADRPEIPSDVATGNPYRYEPLADGLDYKLCITFEESGELCFNRLSQ